MSETGFASPNGSEVEGGEGDSAAPKAAFERSPLKVLQTLESQPLRQAIKAIEYIDAGRERERRLLKVCSPEALNLIAANGPNYVTSLKAAGVVS